MAPAEMLEYKAHLPGGGSVNVVIERKKIKNFYVKISPDGKVAVSMPLNMSVGEVCGFIDAHSKWLEKNIKKFENSEFYAVKDSLCDGGTVQIRDMRYIVFLRGARENKIIKDGFSLYIYSKKAGDRKYVEKQYYAYLAAEAEKYFQNIADEYYPLIEKYGVQRPVLTVKKMKSKWGSCIPRLKKITLNLHLFKTTESCARYVVLHELAHLVYPGHDKNFYGFLKKNMPDYASAEKKLDYEVAGILF